MSLCHACTVIRTCRCTWARMIWRHGAFHFIIQCTPPLILKGFSLSSPPCFNILCWKLSNYFGSVWSNYNDPPIKVCLQSYRLNAFKCLQSELHQLSTLHLMISLKLTLDGERDHCCHEDYYHKCWCYDPTILNGAKYNFVSLTQIVMDRKYCG